MNSPEDGPVGPKHVEIRRYMNKIETVTSVGFSFLIILFCSFNTRHTQKRVELTLFKILFRPTSVFLIDRHVIWVLYSIILSQN